MTFQSIYRKYPKTVYTLIYGSTWLLFLISFSHLIYQLVTHQDPNWWWLGGMIIPTIIQITFWQWLMAHD